MLTGAAHDLGIEGPLIGVAGGFAVVGEAVLGLLTSVTAYAGVA
jgi:hypothetical protein